MIGIIILNYNSANDTIKCIQSIEKFKDFEYKIYVVDGCSVDDSYEYLLSCFHGKENVDIIKSDINGGYSYGNNFGTIKAINEGADSILIINPDVTLVNNAVDIMYKALSKDKDIAVVGPRIVDTKNENMQFAAKLYTFIGFFCTRKPLAFFNNKHIKETRYYPYNFNEDFTFQGMVSGCCFMIKADVFKSIGFFDDNLFLYYEEDILAYKLSKIGKLTKILSSAVVLHDHSKTVKKEGEAFIRFHRFYSSQYVLKKYARINAIQYFVVSLLHIIPFSMNAIASKSYKKLLIEFLKKTMYLYKHDVSNNV